MAGAVDKTIGVQLSTLRAAMTQVKSAGIFA